MKIIKMCMMALLMGTFVFSGISLCQAAQGETMSNAQLVSLLSRVLELEMPAGADRLSDADLFEVQANMLAERGIAQFIDANPDAVVTKGTVASILYAAIIGTRDATTDEKIAYLVDSGYMTTGGENDPMSSGEIITALNTPVLSTAVAETYSAPDEAVGVGVVGGPPRGIPPAPANPTPEGPASPV